MEDFTYKQEGEQRAVMLYFDRLLSQTLNLRPRLRYRIHFYDRRSWICYLNPLKGLFR